MTLYRFDNSSIDNKPISSILQEAAAILDDFEKRTKEKAAKKAKKEVQYTIPQSIPVHSSVVLPTELLSEYAAQRATRMNILPTTQNITNITSTHSTNNPSPIVQEPNTEFKDFLSRSGIRRRSCDLTHSNSKPVLPFTSTPL